MRIVLCAVVGAANRAKSDEYRLLETNCFSHSCCCFAKGLGHISPFRNLTLWLSCFLERTVGGINSWDERRLCLWVTLYLIWLCISLCASPSTSHRDVLPQVPGDWCQCLFWWTPNASQSPSNLSNRSTKCLGASLHDWKIYCYKQQKSNWGAGGVAPRNFSIADPNILAHLTKGVIKLEGPMGTERRCYQRCYSEVCASTFHKNLLFSNDYK